MVVVDGCFDFLHLGHLRYLEAARAYGALCCVVAPDDAVALKHAVLSPWADRVALVWALPPMRDGWVVEPAQPVAQVIRREKPTHYVKGRDWEGRLPASILAACTDSGTQIVYVDTVTRSSSDSLRKLQPDVDAFERLVLNQQPAAEPWQPVTDYSFEARKAIEGKHPELIRDVLRPTSVLDVGCGPGHLVALLRERGVTAIGCDAHVTFDARRGGVRYFNVADEPLLGSDEPDWSDWEQYDLVICREVLEHLTIQHIHKAVTNLCRLSSRYVYLTTRFTQARHFLDFATCDDLDPTHISILPQDWLRHLFVLEGFRRRADLETKMDHQQKGRVLVYERAT